MRSVLASALLVLSGVFLVSNSGAQVPPKVYTLIEGSRITDDCPICDRIPITLPLRGTFELRLLSENPLYLTYALENISWHSVGPATIEYRVTGNGVFRFGGQIMYQQFLYLDVQISNGGSKDPCQFTNAITTLSRSWPMMRVDVDQTNGTPAQQYQIELSAAPFRELWFSTAFKFEAGVWQPPTNSVSEGDLLSSAGYVVKRNRDLTGHLGIQPSVPDLGLKDIDVLPGGEILFSVRDDVFSETLGPLSHGDLLSDAGRIAYSNAELIANYPPAPPAPPDIGVSAVHSNDAGGLFFSVQNGYLAEKPVIQIQSGDLLGMNGSVLRTGKELLAAFKPKEPDKDYGLAAVYIWPPNDYSSTVEIWFSTRDGFIAGDGTAYAPGDLLSDHGYLAYRNEELVAPFAPATTTDLGLDALWVLTDQMAPPVKAVQTTSSGWSDQGFLLRWSGPGRVFQVEKASSVLGPYEPVSSILTEQEFLDRAASLTSSASFYRIRQW